MDTKQNQVNTLNEKIRQLEQEKKDLENFYGKVNYIIKHAFYRKIIEKQFGCI